MKTHIIQFVITISAAFLGQVCLVALFQIQFGKCDNGEVTSVWEPFCSEHLFYKPYIRIKHGRNGKLIKDRGPGFLDVKGLKDIYICTNGLVFLYFKIKMTLGEVYDEAVMQYTSHLCAFYNGHPGPGIKHHHYSLVAILLVGHPDDYRKISLQMFSAPLYNETANSAANYTSLAITNTEGECLIYKGDVRARIRVKGNSPEGDASAPAASSGTEGGDGAKGENEEKEKPTTICLLDVKKLTQQEGGGGDGGAEVPLDKEFPTTTEEALEMLKLSPEGNLRFGGCYDYPLLDAKQNAIMAARVNETGEDSFFIDKVKSELNPGDGEGLQFWTKERLEKYGDPLSPPQEESHWTSEIETKNNSVAEEMAKPVNERDRQKIATDKAEMHLAMLKLKLVPYLKLFQRQFESSKEAAAGAKPEWEAALQFATGENVKENQEKYVEAMKNFTYVKLNQRFDPYDPYLARGVQEAENKTKEFKQKLRAQTLENAPKITKAEVLTARAKSFKFYAQKTMDSIMKIIKDFEKTEKQKRPPSLLPEKFEGHMGFHDTVISIKNAGGGETGKDSACINLPTIAEQCAAVKPDPKRACQIGRNTLIPPDKWPEGDGHAFRDEVFELLGKIFGKACPYLGQDFAESINGIVKGYLTKQPEGTGTEKEKDGKVPGLPRINHTIHSFISNYKIKAMEDLFPKLREKDAEMWDPVLNALKQCEPEVQPLQFEIAGMRPLRFTFQGTPLKFNVDQAEKEFSFNWAIDMSFKIFATVFGTCLEKLDDDTTLPLKFYLGYSLDFLDPIRQIWLSNRDNPLFSAILGRYYVSGKGDLWSDLCMEASFMAQKMSGSNMTRPARELLVNSYTEPNFYAEGEAKGTRGQLYFESILFCKNHKDCSRRRGE